MKANFSGHSIGEGTFGQATAHRRQSARTAALTGGDRKEERLPQAADATRAPYRILCIQNTPDLFGGSRMLLRWLRQTDRRRFQPTVLLPRRGPLADLVEQEGIEVILHPRLSVLNRPAFRGPGVIGFLANVPLSAIYLSRVIRSRQIDLVYSNSSVLASAGLAARLSGVPHVCHVRETFVEFPNTWPIYSAYLKWCSSRILAISRSVCDQFKPSGVATVIHDGISLEEFNVPGDALREAFRQEWQLGGAFVVGCVGRIKLVRKGQEFVVEAAALLKERGLDVKTVLVGGPSPGSESHLAELKDLALRRNVSDRIVFTGEVRDSKPAFAASDVIVLPSALPEPFGGVVAEAMAMGRPVVATNFGGPLDLVVDGETGFLVPPANPTALADAIEKIIRNPGLGERMGRNGRDRVARNFALSEMTARIDKVLQDALGSRRGEHKT